MYLCINLSFYLGIYIIICEFIYIVLALKTLHSMGSVGLMCASGIILTQPLKLNLN